MAEPWQDAVDALGDGGHVGLLHSSSEILARITSRYLARGANRGLLPVIVAGAEEAAFWIRNTLPDPEAVEGGEFGIRFVPVPPRVSSGGLLPILESISEAAVYAEDMGLRGVCIVAALGSRALSAGNEHVAMQAESALASLPFTITLLCPYPVATLGEDLPRRRVFRQVHEAFLIESEHGVSVVSAAMHAV